MLYFILIAVVMLGQQRPAVHKAPLGPLQGDLRHGGGIQTELEQKGVAAEAQVHKNALMHGAATSREMESTRMQAAIQAAVSLSKLKAGP